MVAIKNQRHAVTSFRSLVCAFYDLTFSFREFLDEYPHLHSSIVDTLVGNVFNDLAPLYEALGKFAKRDARAEISTTTVSRSRAAVIRTRPTAGFLSCVRRAGSSMP